MKLESSKYAFTGECIFAAFIWYQINELNTQAVNPREMYGAVTELGTANYI